MKKGAVATAVVASVALCAVVAAFSMNASPYVTVAQAKTISGSHLHVAGDIVKESVHIVPARHRMEFTIKDPSGTLPIIYTGELPTNMAEANKVVAIGGMEGDHFASNQLLIKCPSKYEPEKGDKVADR